eukprot:TRINITY_DN921_c0_g1_i1.p1 TRINITY_DN921_c0_g1~~TRINITY_DN921_c0_g1_i1.p1  ORF type:complete len:184 (+),score=34.73 TRINITY_DN921_c0_g1_i1:80-631(+)
MHRKLKDWEAKLLKKHDFLKWNGEEYNIVEGNAMAAYLLAKGDLQKYGRLCRNISDLIDVIVQMPPEDPFRIKLTDQLTEKLWNMGLIEVKSLDEARQIRSVHFLRRRLATFLVRNNFCDTMKAAVTFIKHGHIKVGVEIVKDPAFFVVRSMEDWVTWSDSSKIKQTILKYNDVLDDYDLLNG